MKYEEYNERDHKRSAANEEEVRGKSNVSLGKNNFTTMGTQVPSKIPTELDYHIMAADLNCEGSFEDFIKNVLNDEAKEDIHHTAVVQQQLKLYGPEILSNPIEFALMIYSMNPTSEQAEAVQKILKYMFSHLTELGDYLHEELSVEEIIQFVREEIKEHGDDPVLMPDYHAVWSALLDALPQEYKASAGDEPVPSINPDTDRPGPSGAS